ncbi:hypothetical protein SAMN05444162_2697 [Paenibacillaceae bacterium GAS479]|nr:hypothetical protein SAMN05444162_2697 [Paenibacillaceae bacterium GAS479]
MRIYAVVTPEYFSLLPAVNGDTSLLRLSCELKIASLASRQTTLIRLKINNYILQRQGGTVMPFLAVLLIIIGLFFGISGIFDFIVGSLKLVFYFFAILFLGGGIMVLFRKIKS